MKSKKNILIVGATGFIGYWLAKKCIKENFKVFSISNHKPKKIRFIKKVKYILCDISNKKKLSKRFSKNIDYVVNLGGYVNHNEKIKTFKSHYLGCKNLVDICKKIKIHTFVQMGSSGEYANSKSPHYEKLGKVRPSFGYNLAKYLSTKYILQNYKRTRFPGIVLRLYQAYGPKQDINRLIPIVINSCLDKKKFPCSTGNQLRDFIYIDDLINLIMRCFKTKHYGQIFNVGSGKPKKIKYIINYINKKLKGGTPEYGKIKLRKEEKKYIYPSIEKAKKYLNWKPSTNFLKGLNKTIQYYRTEKKRQKNKKITAVIPVRKNSQRVKNKNLRKFGQKNLLYYKIQQLKRIKSIDKIVVNTDSEKAIKISKELGIDYWRREKFYASSACKNSDFWKHIGQTTDGEYVLFVNCTSPLIKDRTIKNIITFFKNNKKKYDSVNTASNLKQFMYKNNRPFNFDPSKAPNSQNLPDILSLSFGVSLLSRLNMIKNKSIIGRRPYLYRLDELESVDIDTEIDFKFAEFLFNKQRKKK